MSNNRSSERKMMPRKIAYIVVAIVLLVGFGFGTIFGTTANIGGWFGNGEEQNGFEQAKPQLEQMLIQQKEHELIMDHLDGLRQESDIEKNLEAYHPDEQDAVVATVNGEEIKNKDLFEAENFERQQLLMMGMDPQSQEAEQMMEQMRPQILDNLIYNTILLQKVEQEGITVSEQEIEQEYQMFAQQFGGEEMLEQMLADEGMTRKDLENEIEDQLAMQAYLDKYLEENLDEEDLVFSEQELRELYQLQLQQIQQQELQVQ